MKYWAALLSLVMLTVVVIFITMFGVSSLSVLDSGTNMTGSAYQAQWNTTTNTAITSISIMQLLPYLLVVAAILLSISFFVVFAFKRGRGF